MERQSLNDCLFSPFSTSLVQLNNLPEYITLNQTGMFSKHH